MHLKTRPMHVIWIFGSGFYVRRQVPRSNCCCCCCCCLRFPPTLSHTGTRLHATQSDSTHTHTCTYTYIHSYVLGRTDSVLLSRELHVFFIIITWWIYAESKLFKLLASKQSASFWVYIFGARFVELVFLFFFWIHFKVVFPHSILSFTFALALLTLSLLGSSVAPLTHKRQPLSVDVDVFTTRHSDTFTHTTHSRKPTHAYKQRRTYTHTYMHM